MTRPSSPVWGMLLLSLTWYAVEVGAVRASGLECAEPVFQAGEVRSGAPLGHTFAFVNRGADTLEITDVRPSCGCLTPRLEQRRYPPGAEGHLLLEVNTLTQPAGPHTWRAALCYQTGGQAHELVLLLCSRVITEVTVQPVALTLCTNVD